MIAVKFALSLLFVATNVFGDDSDEAMVCVALLDSFGQGCCESLATSKSFYTDMSSCLPADAEDMACDNIKCILDKQGIMTGDTIDENAARMKFQKIGKEHEDERHVTDRIIRECLDSKFQEYPPEDACPAMKFFTCVFINVQLSCTKWKATDECTKLADDAKKCRELVDEK